MLFLFLPATKCGSIFDNITSDVIQTPNYPQPYPSGITCEWIINPPKDRKVIFLIPKISLPSIVPCSDYLVIRHSSNPYSTATYQTCESNSQPIVFVARSKKLYVKFHSSDTQSGRGFRMPFVTYEG